MEAIGSFKERAPTAKKLGVLDRWYLGISIAILVIVIVGFSKSFIARSVFYKDSLPLYIHIHGLIMSAWFVLGPVQAYLIVSGRARYHRLLGWVGAVLAAIVVALALVVNVALLAKPVPDRARFVDQILFIFWHNNISIIAFAGLVSAAIAARRKSAWHKRLLMFASVNIVAQAAGRIGEWGLLGPLDPFVALFALIALMLALLVADYRAIGRVHLATYVASGVTVLVVVASIFMAASDFGREMLLAWTASWQSFANPG